MATLSSGPVPASKPRSLGIALIALAATIALLYYGGAFFITLITALIVSLILEPFVSFFVRFRIPRGVASFLVCSIALLVLYLLGLGAYTQLSGLVTDLPTYSERVTEFADVTAQRIEQMEQTAYRLLLPKRAQKAPPPESPKPAKSRHRVELPPAPALPPAPMEVHITPERSPIVDYIYSHLGSYYTILLQASFVPFLVYFMLSWRDHLRRGFLQLFRGADRLAAGKSWEGIANMARGYVVGNFVLGLILSLASTVFFGILKLPYFLLVGPLSGFLSLVPYVGLPLAILPPIMAALPRYDRLAPYLIIAITTAFFHLLALNLLYPKVVGSRVHLNPLIVTVALMFWGTLWGGVGLLLAIPITAGIKAVCDNVDDLQPYGRFLGD